MQIKFKEESKCYLSFSSYNCVDEKGELYENLKIKKKLSRKALLRNNDVACFTVVSRATVTGAMFMPEIGKKQDWTDWFKTLKLTGYVTEIEEPLILCRLWDKSLSNRKLDLLKYNFTLFKTIEFFSTFKSYILGLQFLFFHFLYKNVRE